MAIRVGGVELRHHEPAALVEAVGFPVLGREKQHPDPNCPGEVNVFEPEVLDRGCTAVLPFGLGVDRHPALDQPTDPV